MLYDLYDNISVTQVLSAAAATTTQTSSAISLQGFYNLTVVFNIGHCGDTLSGSLYWTLKLQDSPDGTTYTDVTTAGLLGDLSSNTIVINASGQDQKAYKFGYVGGNPYVKAVAVAAGSMSSGTPIGIISLRGSPGLAPTS